MCAAGSIISAVHQLWLLMSYAGCPYYENYGYNPGTGSVLNNGTADRQPDMESCRSFCHDHYPEAKYFAWRSNSSGAACRCRKELMRDQMKETQGVYVGVITCKGEYECVRTRNVLWYHFLFLQRLLSWRKCNIQRCSGSQRQASRRQEAEFGKLQGQLPCPQCDLFPMEGTKLHTQGRSELLSLRKRSPSRK